MKSGQKIHPKERLWRSLIRVIAVSDVSACIVVPAWRSSEEIVLDLANVPAFIRDGVPLPFRCYAHVNTGADQASDLKFADWEDSRTEGEKRLDNTIVAARVNADTDPIAALVSDIFEKNASPGGYEIFPVGPKLELKNIDAQYTEEEALLLARTIIQHVWRVYRSS